MYPLVGNPGGKFTTSDVRSKICKKVYLSNNADPDQTAPYRSDQCLHCYLRNIFLMNCLYSNAKSIDRRITDSEVEKVNKADPDQISVHVSNLFVGSIVIQQAFTNSQSKICIGKWS